MTLFLAITGIFGVHLFLLWIAYDCGYDKGWEEGVGIGKVNGELNYRLNRLEEALTNDQD